MACFQRDQLYKNKRNFASPSYCSYSIKKLTANFIIIMILLRATSRNTLQLKILPEKITKETFMGKHVKGIMYFSFFFFSLKIYCQTVQRQNARLSQLQIKMLSLKRLHIRWSSEEELRRPLPQYSRRKGTESNILQALNVFLSN